MANSPWRFRLARPDYDGHRGRKKTLRRVVGYDKDTFHCWRFVSGLVVALDHLRQSDTVLLSHEATHSDEGH
jgi:hypothetical protein